MISNALTLDLLTALVLIATQQPHLNSLGIAADVWMWLRSYVVGQLDTAYPFPYPHPRRKFGLSFPKVGPRARTSP